MVLITWALIDNGKAIIETINKIIKGMNRCFIVFLLVFCGDFLTEIMITHFKRYTSDFCML